MPSKLALHPKARDKFLLPLVLFYAAICMHASMPPKCILRRLRGETESYERGEAGSADGEASSPPGFARVDYHIHVWVHESMAFTLVVAFSANERMHSYMTVLK